MSTLPRKPDLANVTDLKALASKAFVAFSDLIEFLRALPVVELKRWEGTINDLPITLRLRSGVAPAAVLVGQAHKVSDPTSAVSARSVHWYLSGDQDAAGAVVTDIDSLAGQTHYAVTFVVLGER